MRQVLAFMAVYGLFSYLGVGWGQRGQSDVLLSLYFLSMSLWLVSITGRMTRRSGDVF